MARRVIPCSQCGSVKERDLPERWFTKQQVSDFLACTVRHVERLIASGQLRAYKRPSATVGSHRNNVRIAQSDLDNYRKSYKPTTRAGL